MTTPPRTRADDRGFTLVEVVIAIVLVGILSAVVVVGVGQLTTRGTTAACSASADAARAAATTHLGSTGSYPTTFTAMTSASPPTLTLPDGATIDGTGRIATVGSWTLTLVPGTGSQPPRFACDLPTGFSAGPNGNYYRYVTSPNITWSAASTAAAGFTYNGRAGYLVTITSAAENTFVYGLTGGAYAWTGGTDSAVDTVWRWSGGPEANLQFSAGATSFDGAYANWAPAEPNGGSHEACLVHANGSSQWNDVPCIWPGMIAGYIVEISS